MSFIKYIADENHYKEVLSLVGKANPTVALSAVTKCAPTVGPKDGSFTLQYKSAMAVGKAEMVTDRDEKIEALRAICERFLPDHMDALPYGRACSRSEEPMQASLSSHSITAFDDAIACSLVRTAVVKIILTEPPTGKRKQYDKEGEEMTNDRVQSQAGLSYAE